MEIYEKAQPLESPHPQAGARASCISNLGALYYHHGKYPEAEALYRRALAIQEAVLGPVHAEVAVDLNNLAAVQSQQRRYEEAESLLRRALAIQEQALGADHPDAAATLNNLACLYLDQVRSAEAESLLQRALGLMQSARGRAHPETALYLNNMALYCSEQGRDDAAEPLYRRALAIRRKALGPAHPDVATSLENYAALLGAEPRSGRADRMLARAKAIRARHAEELLAHRWNALPVSSDAGGEAAVPDWVTRLSAAAASVIGETSLTDTQLPITAGPFSGTAIAATIELQEDELRRALDRNELQVYYQPIISLATAQITGAEALLRWQHPRRGLLSPGDFVPLAEATGLILTIGERLLRDACAQCAAWSEAGHPTLRLFVNLSERELRDDRLPERLREVLRATGISPWALHLDITERVVLRDVPFSAKTLEALAATGVRIVLDDAGADPALLEHLERLPVHAVKLDGALVRGIVTDAQAVRSIEAITTRAHALDRTVIALGVETEEQLALVREQRCDEVQGYLFRRAAPAELFTMLLQKEHCHSTELLMEEHLDLRSELETPAAPSGLAVERTLK